MDRFDQELPGDIQHVSERLRAHRHRPDPVELDELKRRALARHGARTERRRTPLARPGIVTVMLVLGLGVSTSAAGVIAGQRDAAPEEQSAVISQYVAGEVVAEPAPPAAPPAEQPLEEEPPTVGGVVEEEPDAAEVPEEAVSAPATRPAARQLPFTGSDILLLLAVLGMLSTAAGLGLRFVTRRA